MNKEQIELVEELLAITKSLDSFKYKCYSFMDAHEVNAETYQDFIMKNVPCNYGMLSRFEKLIRELKSLTTP